MDLLSLKIAWWFSAFDYLWGYGTILDKIALMVACFIPVAVLVRFWERRLKKNNA